MSVCLKQFSEKNYPKLWLPLDDQGCLRQDCNFDLYDYSTAQLRAWRVVLRSNAYHLRHCTIDNVERVPPLLERWRLANVYERNATVIAMYLTRKGVQLDDTIIEMRSIEGHEDHPLEFCAGGVAASLGLLRLAPPPFAFTRGQDGKLVWHSLKWEEEVLVVEGGYNVKPEVLMEFFEQASEAGKLYGEGQKRHRITVCIAPTTAMTASERAAMPEPGRNTWDEIQNCARALGGACTMHSVIAWLNRWDEADSQRWHGDGGTAISEKARWRRCVAGRSLPAGDGGTPHFGTFFSWSPDGETGRLAISFSGTDGFIAGPRLFTRWSTERQCPKGWAQRGWPSHRSGGTGASASIVSTWMRR